ncbi:hypothetical protein IW150_005709 [Coemansia sp. RSA 2607]|nr:hypothetical protein IW150_005709 [Coemansia sp. RSA 2607]KAJ2391343.1 hypothetical protein GGI05_002969 [Coemansia sp. RSA 2603]
MDLLLEVGRQISQTLQDPQVSAAYLAHFLAHAHAESLTTPDYPTPVARVAQALLKLSLHQVSRIYQVPSTYYTWPLSQRALSMLAPSPAHLCKAVVLENKRWRSSLHRSSPCYCVMVQYVHSVDVAKLAEYVRSVVEGEGKVAKKHFNFRLADQETTWRKTGFEKNGVCPFGAREMWPVILCEEITRLSPPVMWMGGGHVDYKLAMPVEAFVRATGCLVADVSVPNAESD